MCLWCSWKSSAEGSGHFISPAVIPFHFREHASEVIVVEKLEVTELSLVVVVLGLLG